MPKGEIMEYIMTHEMENMPPPSEVQGHANSSGNDAFAKLFTESLQDEMKSCSGQEMPFR